MHMSGRSSTVEIASIKLANFTSFITLAVSVEESLSEFEVLVRRLLDDFEPGVTLTAWTTFMKALPTFTALVAIWAVLTAFAAGCNPMMNTCNDNKEKGSSLKAA